MFTWNYHRIFLIMLFFCFYPLADFSKVYKNRHLEDFKFVWSRVSFDPCLTVLGRRPSGLYQLW